jgi:hypothetical protein
MISDHTRCSSRRLCSIYYLVIHIDQHCLLLHLVWKAFRLGRAIVWAPQSDVTWIQMNYFAWNSFHLMPLLEWIIRGNRSIIKGIVTYQSPHHWRGIWPGTIVIYNCKSSKSSRPGSKLIGNGPLLQWTNWNRMFINENIFYNVLLAS